MAYLFYKGEYQKEVQTPAMNDLGIRGKIKAEWPQEWGRDAIVVAQQDSGYWMHWVPVSYYLTGGELQEIGLYPTFDRHKWRDMINLWFLLKP